MSSGLVIQLLYCPLMAATRLAAKVYEEILNCGETKSENQSVGEQFV